MAGHRTRWRKRGEPWVVTQLVLFILFIVAPVAGGDWNRSPLVGMLGIVATAFGIMVLLWSAYSLGRSLTPFPRPLDHGTLVTKGPYRVVRHPIYSGILLMLLGLALATGSLMRLVIVAILLVFFDLKSRSEERWLQERYPEYDHYRTKVKKLIPWLY